jgi:hypothetical protein
MKKQATAKKLSLNKLKISKITNLQIIKGGDDDLEKTGCMFPENASKPKETTIRI